MRGTVHTFPPEDGGFRRDVLEALDALPEMAMERAAEQMTEALRARYPDVLVTARQELGANDDQKLCYAFRDGRIRSASDHRERLAAENGLSEPDEADLPARPIDERA